MGFILFYAVAKRKDWRLIMKNLDTKNISETDYLLLRQKRCVCKQCGNKLELKSIIYNQYGGEGVELYCTNCKRIDFGTEVEIYRLAKEFVDQFDFNYFMDMVENQRNYHLNIAKVCEMLEWTFKRIGWLDKYGIEYSRHNFGKEKGNEK
jgi:hypothetical protein